MYRKKITDIAIYFLLIVVFLAPRLPKIGSFVTLDEPSWLSQGANFYYALGQREFQNTVYEYQPAVTTMWIISAAMLIYFPEYRGFGQGYLDYEKGRLDPFMVEHGYDPLVLLTYSRIIQTFILLILFLVLYSLLQRFLQKFVAAFILVFAMFDPFYLSQTRLMDHEGMVSLFVLISLTAFAIYLFKDRRMRFLLVSGVAAGFAQLSKSSAIAMLAALGVMLLIQIFQEREQGWGKAILNSVKLFTIWFAFLVLTYFVFWPGMWVAPGKMLYQVYGNAFSYAFQGARLTVTEELEPATFSLNTNVADVWEVAKILLYRTTPVTWLGVLLGFALPFTRTRELVRQNRLLFTLLLTNALAFILLIGIAQGRNSPHYILSSYLSLNLLAGLGWYYFLRMLADRFSFLRSYGQYALLGLVMLAQVWNTVSTFPYYFTYRNPISYSLSENKDFPQFPYGEGLEFAAQYLAELPDAKDSTALVYYSRGCFSYFYPGTTTGFRPYYVDGEHAIDLLNFVQDADYLVVYYANQGQLEKYGPYLDILSTVEPIHEIWMDGYKYVQIYRVDFLPAGNLPSACKPVRTDMNKNKWNLLLTIFVLLILIVPSHVIGIDKVVTVDEPWWVISGSNYYYALTRKDFASTIYDYHPAVTTTWIVTAGMLSYFPEYRGFGQGYFDIRKPKFEEFMRENGKEAIDLVRNSRLVQSTLLIALAVLGFFLLLLLIDQTAALLAIALAMTEPFFLGHSRLLNHEGMLAVFVLVSFLGMQVYLNRERKLIYLLISGAAFGLAQLTKSSSIVVVGLVGLMLFFGLFKCDGKTIGIRLWDAVKTFAVWFGVAALVYFILWPGMWVAPSKMLSGVYGNAFSYAFQGARLDVTEELQPSSFSLVNGLDGVFQYLRSWAASSTFITWLGLVFALLLLTSKKMDRTPAPLKSTLVYLVVLAGLFILMFGVAQGRNSPHYILSSYVCLDVIAGIGWGSFLMWAQKRWAVLNRAYVNILAVAVLAAIQIGVGLSYFPYYFTYKNPFAERAATLGYGEGLSQAADYLAEKPNAQNIRAYVYNGMGTFSFYFPGETLVLKRVNLINDDFITITNDMRSSDYLVLYPITRSIHPETEKILLELEGVVEPEKVIYINGLEYIQIYRVVDIPEFVYEALLKKQGK